jgi:hypothetical protein
MDQLVKAIATHLETARSPEGRAVDVRFADASA